MVKKKKSEDPWDFFIRILNEMEREMNEDFVEEPTIVVDSDEPLISIDDSDDKLIITMEILGVKKEDIKVHVTERELKVSAGNKFYKKIELPSEVNPDEAEAFYKNGVLEVKMKKKHSNK
jgi:HSP20 family protein